MRIIGLDPGFGRLGYAVIETVRGHTQCLTCGCFETEKERSAGVRLVTLRDAVRTLLKKFHPEQAVIERLYFSKNVRTALAVAEARGMLLTLLGETNVPVLEVSPQEVKSGVTGKGNAPKEQVQRMVTRIFRLDKPPKPDDAADALAIAYAATARAWHVRRGHEP
ncbi:MAG: crossover junction endodeoxyribonuclease RuvC [Parcubacteria group bacterium Gr01-1014_38]|nr:MAG: crossover junction endodeoxyribonuclease RuvC [Parcubacteria group bacterium Gr01-1014_38]